MTQALRGPVAEAGSWRPCRGLTQRKRLLRLAAPHLDLPNPLVLVDVGASLGLFEPFTPLRHLSVCIGFDPDRREAPAPGNDQIFVPSAIAPAEDIVDGTVTMTLTHNPTCSSRLPPVRATTGSYSFAPRFTIVGHETVPATTLAAGLASVGQIRLDWLKLDTQGTDLRILTSLDERLAASLSCVDVEPGLAPFYEDEDVFSSVHQHLLDAGFWLADLTTIDSSRIESSLVDRLPLGWWRPARAAMDISLAQHHGAPVAVGARYLRTANVMGRSEGEQGLRRLWACAVAAGATPFAYEVASTLMGRSRNPNDVALAALSRKAVIRGATHPVAILKKLTPDRCRRAVRSHF